jgi:drug efflux transport system permease protein
MKSQRLLAVARKEFIHLIRDPRSLAIGIGLPIIMLLLFGFALTMDVDHVPIVIWNQNQNPMARDFVNHFQASRYFTIVAFVDHYSDVERTIDARKALAGLIIPVNFSQELQSGKTATVQWIVDGSDSNTATLATGYAQSVTQIFSRDIQMNRVERSGKTAPNLPLDLRSRVWFNADMESRNYIIPGLIAVIMMVIAGLLTSLTIAREWDTGTMEQLISTPVKVPELIIGKLIPYFCIAFLDVIIAVLMGQFLFHVPLRGNVFLIFASSIIFLIGALSLGMVISIATKSQLLASQIALVATFLPTFLLSGFSFDIANMPIVLQVISRALPATYFIKILKGIYLKGVGLNVLYGETLFLIAFAIFLLVVANVKFKKKMV